MNWIKTSERLPTNIPLEQVRVLFYSPGWASPVMGVYTCPIPDDPDDMPAWGETDLKKDRLHDWPYAAPEYWCQIVLPDDDAAAKGVSYG